MPVLSNFASYFALPLEIGSMLVSWNMYCVLSFHRGLKKSPGNAKIAGMSTDLNLIGFRYNIAAAVFFVRHVSRLFHQMLRYPL